MNRLLVLVVIAAAALAVLPGCDKPDCRVADMAQQVTHEQAEQNHRIAEGSRAIAEGSQQLVENDAKARRELIGLQRDLQQDQSAVTRERDKLEAERKAIASERVEASKAGVFFVGLAIILVCLSPLILAGISLLGLWHSPTREEEREVLVEELAKCLGPDGPRGFYGLSSDTSRAIGLPGEGPSSAS